MIEPGERTSEISEAPGVPSSAGSRGSFWFHVILLAMCYLTVVIAWGQRNSWPDELLLSIATIPLNVVVAWQLYQTHHFGTAVDPTLGQQEQLIAALVLAVGLASGQLLLMGLGLVCLGIGWLRPVRPGVDWAEWLKIPLIFMTALPFWIDFEGGGVPLADVLSNPLYNPPYRLPLAVTTSELRVIGYCGLIAMALVLHGRVFWLSLPLLPAFLALTAVILRGLATVGWLPETVRISIPWILGIACMSGLSRLTRKLDDSGRHLSTGQTMRRWFSERRHPPWLAVLVVAVAQTLPFRAVRAGVEEFTSLGGLLILCLILVVLRHRTPKGPIHSRSVAMVAGGLALTLLGEFVANDELCHLALGMVLVGLLSWHCFWPLRIFAISTATVILLVGIPDSRTVMQLPLHTTFGVRTAAAAAMLLVLGALTSRPLPRAGEQGYDETGWVPSRRFALILLGLMMLFQTASAFWPEHDLPLPAILGEDPRQRDPDSPPTLKAITSTGPAHPLSDSVQVSMAYPRRNPYLLQSPERMLQRRGWRILRAERFPHPYGEAMGIKMENAGRTATTLWWYELGDAAFPSHLYARRILWSSWHLANRDLRLVQLESTGMREPEELVAYAERQNWFLTPETAPPAAPSR